MKTAAIPPNFPVGRLQLSKILPRAISGRATGYTPGLPPMISPFGGQAPSRTPQSTQEGDVRSINARGKGTLSQFMATKKTVQQDIRGGTEPHMPNSVAAPTDGADQVAQGSGQRREADIQKVARQLLRERLASLRV